MRSFVFIWFVCGVFQGHDSVIECMYDKDNNRILIRHSYNQGHNNIAVPNVNLFSFLFLIPPSALPACLIFFPFPSSLYFLSLPPSLISISSLFVALFPPSLHLSPSRSSTFSLYYISLLLSLPSFSFASFCLSMFCRLIVLFILGRAIVKLSISILNREVS